MINETQLPKLSAYEMNKQFENLPPSNSEVQKQGELTEPNYDPDNDLTNSRLHVQITDEEDFIVPL